MRKAWIKSRCVLPGLRGVRRLANCKLPLCYGLSPRFGKLLPKSMVHMPVPQPASSTRDSFFSRGAACSLPSRVIRNTACWRSNRVHVSRSSIFQMNALSRFSATRRAGRQGIPRRSLSNCCGDKEIEGATVISAHWRGGNTLAYVVVRKEVYCFRHMLLEIRSNNDETAGWFCVYHV